MFGSIQTYCYLHQDNVQDPNTYTHTKLMIRNALNYANVCPTSSRKACSCQNNLITARKLNRRENECSQINTKRK